MPLPILETIDLLSDDEYYTPQSIRSDDCAIKNECKQIKPIELFINLCVDTPEIPTITSVKNKLTSKIVSTPQSLKPGNKKLVSKKNNTKIQSNTIDKYFPNSASVDRKTVLVSNINVSSTKINVEEGRQFSEYDKKNTINDKIKINSDISTIKFSRQIVTNSALFVPTTDFINNQLIRWMKQEFIKYCDTFKSDIENEDSPFLSIQSTFLESFRHICQYTEVYDCITIMKAITILKRALNIMPINNSLINHYGFQVSDLLVCEYQEKYERGLTQIQTQELNSINILLIGLFHSLKWIQPYDLPGFDVQTTYITFDLVKQWIDNSIFAINNDNYSEAVRLLGRLQCIGNVSHSISQPFTDALNLLYKAIKLYRTITSNILLQNLISTLSRIIVKIANQVYFICELKHQQNNSGTSSINAAPILQKRGRNSNICILEFDTINKAPSKKTKKTKAIKEIDDGIKASIHETFQKFYVQSNVALIEQKVYNINSICKSANLLFNFLIRILYKICLHYWSCKICLLKKLFRYLTLLHRDTVVTY